MCGSCCQKFFTDRSPKLWWPRTPLILTMGRADKGLWRLMGGPYLMPIWGRTWLFWGNSPLASCNPVGHERQEQ